MEATALAIRAVVATFVGQLFWPVVIIVGGAYALIFSAAWWLATSVHTLWWLLVILLTPLFFVITLVLAVSYMVLRQIRPTMNLEQRTLAKTLVSHINGVAEQAGTPKFIILGITLKDIVTKRSLRDSYIAKLTREPGKITHEFSELRDSFR